MSHQKKVIKSQKKHSVETTGHSWDGIEEYNNPLPRWWLWTFYLTIIWAGVYVIFYPAIPLLTQATPGIFGYNSREAVQSEISYYQEANAHLDAALYSTELATINERLELAHYAKAGGAALFFTHCSQCHGAGAEGSKGYPNLLDDDWLWGGDLTSIYKTIRHGIRSDEDDETRFSEMPAFGELLEPSEIINVKHYVLSISGGVHSKSRAKNGRAIFIENCAGCHGNSGEGNHELGAPNLRDNLWLFGKSPSSISETIIFGRKGIMPAWKNRLTEAQLKQVAFYVHQLGGGE